MANNTYDGSSIVVLKDLEAVRVRPAMYIGDTDKRGLHHLAWEVLDNSVDEAMAGFCSQIKVTLHSDGETLAIEDNGRGIPVDIHQDYAAEGKTALEVVMTVLHSGGKFTNENYAGGSGGLHGVGVSCVNALSEILVAEVWRDGGHYKQEYSRGTAITPCERINNSYKKGTCITFKADKDIFPKTVRFDEELIIRKLREMAFLNAGLKIIYQNDKSSRTENFQFDGGIKDYVTWQTSSKDGHYPSEPFYFKNKNGGSVEVQVSFQYTSDDDEVLLSFANNICTVDGGTHLSGFKTAFTRVINQFAHSSNILKANDNNLSGDDVREGITAIISVRLPQPQFEGQTKARLGSVEADSAVNVLFGEALTDFLEKNPAMLKTIVERAVISQKAREAAKKESEAFKRKSFLGKSRLPGKLRDCASEDRTKTEIFICEGDSAAGAATMGRDANTQAILPIRGKIINAEKNDIQNLLKNTEIQSLISCIGTGIAMKNEDEFNLDNRRYDKIILMTDADVDGSHIAILLLTFFYRFMRPLVLGGHIHLAQPPLFKIEGARKIEYCWTVDEMNKIVTKMGGSSKTKVMRFKGLGEMNAKELAQTTMNKATRRLIKVEIDDMFDTDKLITTLMGHNVADRKAYIVKHSESVKKEQVVI
jgi:DNA gyrase subunit B